jgi:hypothetical protein
MQNLVSLTLTAQDLSDFDTAIGTLRRLTAIMRALDSSKRRHLNRMGEKSEFFCRQTLNVLAANPQVVPATLDIAEAQRDLLAVEQLRPRLGQLEQILERMDDTVAALGSEVIVAAIEGYALLGVTGKTEGLKAARRELSSRWAKGPRQVAEAEEDAPNQ